jgi:hypothetical protein
VVLTDPEHVQAALLGQDAVADDVVDPAGRGVRAAGIDVGEGEDTEFHESPNPSRAAGELTPPQPPVTI